MAELLAGLNPAQTKAVAAPDGPVLVLAGPGSGKTRVLTRRIAYLLHERGVQPWRLVAVTFTNKAAREMAERIRHLVGGDLQDLSVGTFHATCARLLRIEADHLPIDRDYLIFDSSDQEALMKDIVSGDLQLDEKRYKPRAILGRISSLKNELITADDFVPGSYFEEIVKRAYMRYQERLAVNNGVDFDDLLMHTTLLLRDNDAVRSKYQGRYDHVLVDEFQDTNFAQYQLVRLLSARTDNLFCVGDEDQSIYRWRGADYRNIQRLKTDYPDLMTILLEQNYRSTQTILDASRAVIDRNTLRTPKKLFTEHDGGPVVTIYEAYDENDEAQFVVDTIATLIATSETEPGECAVMYRVNAQSRALEEGFLRAGLPYRLVGATRFYGRKEIKDMIAFLRIIHNPDDEISMMRVINTPTRGIGAKTAASLSMWASTEGITPGEALLRLAQNPAAGPFGGRARGALADFARTYHDWRAVSENVSLGELTRQILEDTGYLTFLNDGTEQGEERVQNVLELVNLTAEAEGIPLGDFLAEVALVADVDTLTEDVNAPSLMTLHSAKGLEYDAVFLVGLEEGMLPHSRSLDEPEEMAEERRLMYVGMTRARKHLFLTYTFQRMVWGDTNYNQRSRFIDDIPGELVHAAKGMALGGGYQRATRWSSMGRPPRVTEEKESGSASSYKTGQRVRHPKFGEGIVIESKPTGSDVEVSVAFEELGVKRLLASFAQMEILED